MEIATSETQFKAAGLLYLQKAVIRLKSDGGITIRLPSVDWAESRIAIEVRCDVGGF